MNRVSYNIVPWPGGRYRAELLFEGRLIEKSFHDTAASAEAWCQRREAELAREMAR